MGTAAKAADTSDLSLSSAQRWHLQTTHRYFFFFLSQSWAGMLQGPSMRLRSASGCCLPRVCGFAFGGGAPLVMGCKMAALCQEKVRQRLVTLGKIRQEESKNVLPAYAWFCLHKQWSSGFPHLLLSHRWSCTTKNWILSHICYSVPCGGLSITSSFYFRRSFFISEGLFSRSVCM